MNVLSKMKRKSHISFFCPKKTKTNNNTNNNKNTHTQKKNPKDNHGDQQEEWSVGETGSNSKGTVEQAETDRNPGSETEENTEFCAKTLQCHKAYIVEPYIEPFFELFKLCKVAVSVSTASCEWSFSALKPGVSQVHYGRDYAQFGFTRYCIKQGKIIEPRGICWSVSK